MQILLNLNFFYILLSFDFKTNRSHTLGIHEKRNKNSLAVTVSMRAGIMERFRRDWAEELSGSAEESFSTLSPLWPPILPHLSSSILSSLHPFQLPYWRSPLSTPELGFALFSQTHTHTHAHEWDTTAGTLKTTSPDQSGLQIQSPGVDEIGGKRSDWWRRIWMERRREVRPRISLLSHATSATPVMTSRRPETFQTATAIKCD